ncbi:MAG: flagellar export chaperone FliS [Woeseiaceae bacterium]
MYSPAPHPAAKAYQQLDTQSRIEDASPHRLILLMMVRALGKIGLARSQMTEGNIAEKGNNISDAISIINGLQASLNHKADQRMAENFDALYAYMMRRLLEAKLQNDESILDEVAGLLRELKEAWDAIADEV